MPTPVDSLYHLNKGKRFAIFEVIHRGQGVWLCGSIWAASLANKRFGAA